MCEETSSKVKPGSYTTNFMQLGAMQGWQCPICKRVLSPWTPECPCRGQGMETYTTTTGTGKDTDYIKFTKTSVSTKGNPTITLHSNNNEDITNYTYTTTSVDEDRIDKAEKVLQKSLKNM